MTFRAIAFLALCLFCGSLAAAEPELQDKDQKVIPPISELVKMKGDPANGQVKYSTICFICHQINGQGIDFGPNLSEVGSRLTKDLIFQSILSPSAVIAPGFDQVTLKLEDSVVVGIVVSENDQEVVLKMMGGIKQTVKKADIVSRAKSPTSMMPAGLQANMSTQDLVDLATYLSSLKKAQ